jgi:O-antigen/teichoic acid export membrane protein
MTKQTDSLRAHAARGGKWTAISAAAGVSLQMAQLVVLGRLLGPADFGLMAMMMVVIGLANAIADFGLGSYLVQADRLCRSALNKLLSTATALSLVLAGMVAFSADVVAAYYKTPHLTVFLPWLSMAIVATTLGQMLFALLQRSFAFKAIAVGEIASALVALVATIAVALGGHGVWALVVGQLVAGASRLLLFLPHFLQLRRGLPISLDMDLHKARGFALFQTGERVLNYVGWNIDKLILGRLVGEVGLGLYTVAYQLMIRPFSVLNPIFTRVALPLFSSIKNDDPRLISGYLQTLRVIALLSFPVYVGISIAAPGIIMLVMGERWAASAPVLSLLSVLGMFFSIGNPIGTLILAKGKPQWAFYINLASLLVYALAFAIGAQFGVMGVAWAFLLASVVVLYPLEFFLRYQLVGMRVSQYFKAMMHLFTAAAVPLLVHGLWQGMHSESLVPNWSFLWSTLAVLFFYGYVWLFEMPLLVSVKNLIFKGK